MKTRESIIKTEILEIDYDASLTKDLIEDYVMQDLEVPQECIESLRITNDIINIKLSQGKRYFNDDRYVNLQRVA